MSKYKETFQTMHLNDDIKLLHFYKKKSFLLSVTEKDQTFVDLFPYHLWNVVKFVDFAFISKT